MEVEENGEQGGYYNNNNNNNNKSGSVSGSGSVGGWWWNSVRRRMNPESHFFDSGNFHRELCAKHIALDISEEEEEENKKTKQQQQQFSDHQTTNIPPPPPILLIRDIFCPIVGCGAQLESLDTFEDHYNSRHRASCSTCSAVYPTSRLLSIHVSESHDSFFQAKVARGFPMYECLVESCGMKLKSYKSRQQHLVDKHNFPSSFEFFKKSQPSRKHRRKTRKKGAQVHKNKEEDVSSAMQVEEETLNGLVSAVSKLSTSDSSPSSVSFGRRHTRGLTFVPRAVQRVERPQ